MGERRVIPVSLIITTLNEKRQVPLFFEGVRNGSVLPEEVSVCDGGSSDGTWEAIAEQRIEGVRITASRLAGANIARGRNRAIRQSSNALLAITDAGCLIEAEWLERITAPLLKDGGVDAVSGGYAAAGGSFLQRCTAASMLRPEDYPPGAFLPSSRSFAVRREAMESAGLYPEHMTFAGEDTALMLRMKSMGLHFVERFDARVHWYTRDSLKAFARQFYMYGLGDGEARSHTGAYLRGTLRLALPVLIATAPFVGLGAFAAALALNVLYYLRLRRTYRWGREPVAVSLGAFGLTFLKTAASTAGWLRGVLGPRRTAWTGSGHAPDEGGAQ